MDGDLRKPEEENNQTPATPEPTSLGEALRYIDHSNRMPAEEPVEGAGSPEGSTEVGAGGSELPADNGQGVPSGEEPAVGADGSDIGQQGVGDDLGGSAAGIDAIDFNTQKQQLLRDVQRNAINQVRREYKEQNIGYYSIDELYRKDENTGRVSFVNPDDPDGPGFSSRSECQQWINAWNQAVDSKFRQDVNAKQQELVVQELPKVRVMDFYPTYMAMDKTTQSIFDQLVDQYALKDANGETYGYNVDLNAVGRQAAGIAKMFQQQGQGQQQQQQAEPAAQQQAGGNTPALDMKTGNGKSLDDENPTTIQEAMRIYNKKNRRKL